MRAQEAITFTSAAPGPVPIQGGRYSVMAQATFGGGSVKLQATLPDGTTYISVGSSTDFTAANTALVVVELPPGSYKATITTATAVTMTLVRIPGE